MSSRYEQASTAVSERGPSVNIAWRPMRSFVHVLSKHPKARRSVPEAESAKSALESPVLSKINDNQAAGTETQGSNGKLDIKV